MPLSTRPLPAPHKKTMAQFIKFSMVGTAGFVVDVAVLTLLLSVSDLGYFWGRLISFLAAATVTWALNRAFTFDPRSKSRRLSQWGHFLAVNSVGGAINYGTYSILILSSAVARESPMLAVAAGSIAGLLFNFNASRRLVFRN